MTDASLIRCAVIDDEFLSVELISNYIRQTPGLQLVAGTTRAGEVLQLVAQDPLDLLFVDIQMPELTGIEITRLIGRKVKVIFTTAYANYAVDGFELDIADFLLKPVSYERFLLAVDKIKSRMGGAQTVNAVVPADHIFVKTTYRNKRVNFSDIYYLEALRDYIGFHTTGGKLLTLDSMRNLETILPAEQFIRIHKSYLINKSKIDFIEKGHVVINQVALPIGNAYRESFLKSVGLG
ncbi:LytR/AlgR family response regulator transcription factor [Terrimonas rubra]|uniref:LytR/AlgR family response regulator transcription factor n=1 Tax=Terrimonas rubra TaxID=1035890 RepID=A0ABW6A4S2_9BACT